MRVFAISGYSGSGKTTVVEKIVQSLCERGYSIITVKSSAHDVVEEKWTDTWRHRRAGARDTIILGPESTVVTYSERLSLQSLLEEDDADYLIIEGMKESNIPKFWCVGPSGLEEEKLPSSVKAIVFWEKNKGIEDIDVRIIQADDIQDCFRW